MAAVSNAPVYVSLPNVSLKASRYVTRRQTNSADGSIVEAEAPTKRVYAVSVGLILWLAYHLATCVRSKLMCLYFYFFFSLFFLLSYNSYNSYNTGATYSTIITYKNYAFTALCITYYLTINLFFTYRNYLAVTLIRHLWGCLFSLPCNFHKLIFPCMRLTLSFNISYCTVHFFSFNNAV